MKMKVKVKSTMNFIFKVYSLLDNGAFFRACTSVLV